MTPPERLVSVVEDEDTIREMVCLALTKAGYRTEAFGDGMHAWDAFVRALPDLVILDIGLPRLDGLEICRRLRTRSATTPLVIASGTSSAMRITPMTTSRTIGDVLIHPPARVSLEPPTMAGGCRAA